MSLSLAWLKYYCNRSRLFDETHNDPDSPIFVVHLNLCADACGQNNINTCKRSWSQQGWVIVLIDDGSSDVSVQNIDTKCKNSQLDETIVTVWLFWGPPTHDAQRDVKHRCKTLKNKHCKKCTSFINRRSSVKYHWVILPLILFLGKITLHFIFHSSQNYLIIWIITGQEISKGEVKLQRKLYPKLIESSVKPSLNLGASSRKYCADHQINQLPWTLVLLYNTIIGLDVRWIDNNSYIKNSKWKAILHLLKLTKIFTILKVLSMKAIHNTLFWILMKFKRNHLHYFGCWRIQFLPLLYKHFWIKKISAWKCLKSLYCKLNKELQLIWKQIQNVLSSS